MSPSSSAPNLSSPLSSPSLPFTTPNPNASPSARLPRSRVFIHRRSSPIPFNFSSSTVSNATPSPLKQNLSSASPLQLFKSNLSPSSLAHPQYSPNTNHNSNASAPIPHTRDITYPSSPQAFSNMFPSPTIKINSPPLPTIPTSAPNNDPSSLTLFSPSLLSSKSPHSHEGPSSTLTRLPRAKVFIYRSTSPSPCHAKRKPRCISDRAALNTHTQIPADIAGSRKEYRYLSFTRPIKDQKNFSKINNCLALYADESGEPSSVKSLCSPGAPYKGKRRPELCGSTLDVRAPSIMERLGISDVVKYIKFKGAGKKIVDSDGIGSEESAKETKERRKRKKQYFGFSNYGMVTENKLRRGKMGWRRVLRR